MAKRKETRQEATRVLSEATSPEWRTVSATSTRRRSQWIAGMALTAILALGWHVRFDNFYRWNTSSQRFFVDGEPILINSDGYYYLRLARDLVQGTYAEIDEKRNVPDCPRRPSPPPLLSSLTALVNTVTGIPLNWIAIVIPTVLGCLIAIPVYLLARVLGGGLVMGLTAALMATLGIEFVDRTRVGFFDTDSLNVVFTLLSAYFATRFAVTQDRTRVWSFAWGMLVYLLFLWWWDQVPHFVLFISLLPLIVALFYGGLRGISRRTVFSFLSIILLAALLGLREPATLLDKVVQLMKLVTGRQEGYFPTVEVGELSPVPWSKLIDLTTGHPVSFVVSVLGLAGFAAAQRRLMPFLAIPTALAALPVFFGQRFAIFTIPIVALGLGYAFEKGLVLIKRHTRAPFPPVINVAWFLLILLNTYPAYQQDVGVFRGPITHRTVEGISAIRPETEQDAVIWTGWTAGYALAYRADRSTIIDGQSMQGEAHYYAALPLAESSQRLAANFMQFYVGRGIEGIHRIYRAFGDRPDEGMAFIKAVLSSSAGQAATVLEGQDFPAAKPFSNVTEGLQFFFPRLGRPLYLLLYKEQVFLSNWFYYGSWDLVERRGTNVVTVPYFGVIEKNGRLQLNRESSFDRVTGGSMLVRTNKIPEHRAKLAHLFEHDGRTATTIQYNNDGSIAFEWIKPAGFGVLMSNEFSESVFNQLFIRYHPEGKYFQKVELKTPEYQIWRVSGDQH